MSQNSLDRQPLLSVQDLVKTFGAVRAVDGVTLDLYEQEVVGVIGDNGAGKSTFLSLLAGFHQPDAGACFYRGKPVAVTSPRTARNHMGIEMIYQNLELAPDLTVWENLFLGEELTTLGFLSDRRRMSMRAADVLRRLKTKVRPDEIVGNLSGGEKQVVAIGRALLFDRDVVIMDEPTAAISIRKVDDVLDLIRRLKSVGKTVILVSHRLEDIIAVCDRVVVFRHGKIRTVLQAQGLEVNDLIHQMF